MQVIQLFKTYWFVMGLGGCAFFGEGLFMVGYDYYYCDRVWHSTFLQASPLVLVGLAMILTAAGIKKLEDRLNQLEARRQDDKQFDATPSAMTVLTR